MVIPGTSIAWWVGRRSYIMGQCPIQDSCPRVQRNDADTNDADFSDADADADAEDVEDVEDVENLRGRGWPDLGWPLVTAP